MRVYRFPGLLIISLLVLHIGCSGKLVIDESELDTKVDPTSCIAVTCSDGYECVEGQCRALDLCNPLHTDGYCGPGQRCANGVCVSDTVDLVGCGESNTLCAPGEICENGVCGAIAQGEECAHDPALQEGKCPLGQQCVHGWCYFSDGINCSESQLDGVCDSGFRCSGGACLEDEGTCSIVIQDGTCTAWQECVRGDCVGPVATDACGPQALNGRCPADEICVGGTCTFISNRPCSLQNPKGLCPAGAGCDGGQCRQLTASNQCASSQSNGLCLGGAQCENGACAQVPCGSGGVGCGLGHYCNDANECKLLGCDAVHPNGTCQDTTLACVRGSCLAPDCNAENQDGFCPPGLVCNSGECGVPACSELYPFGECPEGKICDSGICINKPCAADNLNGECNETVAFCHPDVGCNNFLDSTCCDQTLADATGCDLGICAAPACAPDQPYGACLEDYVCVEGSCTLATCSPFYPDGVCENADEECTAGRCARTGCTAQADPDAFCAPDICDTNLDICATPPCSANHPDGLCPLGTVCCNSNFESSQGCSLGQCFQPLCSPGFPGGNCSENEVCVGGVCTLAPCGQDFPNGACGVNYRCEAGQCVRAACSAEAPQGLCAAGQRCISGACVVFECSEQFPTGPCPPGELCDSTSATPTCVTPACSPETPGGACQGNEVCSNGVCVLPGCSSEVPNGQCPANQFCQSGVCVLRPCAPDVLDGECEAGKVCCDTALITGGFCTNGQLGSCRETECSTQFPYGMCPEPTKVCVSDGNSVGCVDLCSSSALSGWCPDLFACVDGACSLACANDHDCDGISDAAEEGIDTDLDGSDDSRDRDSDGDTIPDAVEFTSDMDGDLVPNYRDTDSDGDYLLDSFEVGIVPSQPLDFDLDGDPDYLDTDSDDDGILDRCEASTVGNCANTSPLNAAHNHDGDSLADFHDSDSDEDGIPDSIEARFIPNDPSSQDTTGVDHDADGIPDYRDTDSDGDGVDDADEDINGDGFVNCQLDGSGNAVGDTRPAPACGQSTSPFSVGEPYNYNPGCPTGKCVLAESSRVHADTDGDGIGDGQDGVFQVCSSENLKPINLFYSRYADYALALEQDFNSTIPIYRGGSSSENEAGLTFDATSTVSGSYGVSGFILSKTPDAAAMAAQSVEPDRLLIEKALAQASADTTLLEEVPSISSVSLIINRNFSTFDGFGAVISRFEIKTVGNETIRDLRNDIVDGLDATVSNLTGSGGPGVTRDFILQMETLYRYDNGNLGSVLVVGALSPKGSGVDDEDTYAYRTQCSKQNGSGSCNGRDGCEWQSGACVEASNYQIPLFFVDNITNGSSVAQYGDDIAALCQSLIQDYAKVDFLWVVDNSGSMGDEINQVLNSTQLFFELMNQTEADYRVGQTSTMATAYRWPPQADFKNPDADQSLTNDSNIQDYCDFGSAGVCNERVYCKWDSGNGECVPDDSYSVNGFLRGGFTGAIAGQTSGQTSGAITDRDFSFDCSAYPQNCTTNSCGGSACCPACDGQSGTIEEPSCYFAANLPCASGSGAEYGLTMGQWAVFRSGAESGCTGLDTTACGSVAGCEWRSGGCYQAYCSAETNALDCDGIAHCLRVGQLGSDACNQDSECTWNNGECSLDTCTNLVGESNCNDDPRCAWQGNTCQEHVGWYCATLEQTDCDAEDTCTWQIYDCASDYCASITNDTTCDASPKCHVDSYSGRCIDTFESTIAANCEWDAFTKLCLPIAGTACRSASSESDCIGLLSNCYWDGASCRPDPADKSTLCSGTSQGVCESMGGSINGQAFCQWEGDSCSPLSNYAFRENAAKVAVMLSDEEACSLRDGPNASGFDGNDGFCSWFGNYGVGITPYESSIRASRTKSFTDFYRARGFTVFAITGDKPNLAIGPSGSNGGCDANGNRAEAGQGYISVAEGTGGGWGSICAADLYPSIESVVISSISKGSPYTLESVIEGRAVQPIASTIQVAAEVCDVPNEYPTCSSGTHMEVIPRSRDNGYDYDALNNTLIFYGEARPKETGDITVSYRYWVDLSQPVAGNPDCPCPEASAPSCACSAGRACGATDSPSANYCQGLVEGSCGETPGCQYNSVLGCLVNGICEPDPTCGGSCPAGEVCDSLTGLCICDKTCGGQCAVGLRCDVDENSGTCGQCLCDDSCGGGCPAGQNCESDPSSATCGQCSCDTTCSGACTQDLICNADIASPSCGFCEPPQCGSCLAGSRCDASSGLCVCDTECGGGCPAGQACDPQIGSATCGQCLCDTTCGGNCPSGTICDSENDSASCGRCVVDPNCGGSCTEGEVCNPITGLCEPTCPECGIGEVCDALTAQCVCAQTCGGSCPEGSFCDSDLASNTCGSCVCDTTCGGSDCPVGQVCDDGSYCDSLTSISACEGDNQCVVDSVTGECFSPTCGRCAVDPTCGGDCPPGTACDPLSGLCITDPDCGGCPPNFQCNPLTGQCDPVGG